MENNDEFVKSRYSIEDLEQFRDKNGFIDLTQAEIVFTAQSREVVGNPDRIKNWVNFNGQKALIKGEAILGDEKNYGIYAELIVEEIARQLGVETAHYDLVKILDEGGNEVYGVLSKSVVDTDKGEQLISLRDIIGDEPIGEGDFIDTTSLDFTVDKLRENLLLDGYSEEDVEKLIIEYKKRLAFSLAVIDTDKHTENIAFVKKKVNGKDVISICPNFDSESALMLDNDYTTVEMLLNDYYGLQDSVNIAHPRIGTLKSKSEGGHNSFWKDTLEELYEDDEVLDYCDEVLQGKIDMDVVLENVEKRIKAKLHENVRYLAKYAFNIRNEQMINVMSNGIEDTSLDDGFDINALLKNIINSGLKNEITSGEMLRIGKQMQADITIDKKKTIEGNKEETQNGISQNCEK